MPLIVSVAGLACYFAVAKLFLSASPEAVLSWVARVSPPLMVLAIAVRALVVPLEATIFLLSARSVGGRISYGSAYRGICASLAMEYVVPFGGLTEVYKVFFLSRQGLTLNEATVAMFVHRIAMSSSLLVMCVVTVLLVPMPHWLRALFLLTSLGLVASNVVGTAVLRRERFGRALGSLAKRIVDRVVSRFVPLPPSMYSVFEFRSVDLRLLPLLAAFAIACCEHLLIALSGLVICVGMGLSFSLPQALLVFDVIQSILWLLPAVTPGSVGVLEVIQLGALKALGSGSWCAAVPILYRIVILCSMLPQLMPMLVTDVRTFLQNLEEMPRAAPSTSATL